MIICAQASRTAPHTVGAMSTPSSAFFFPISPCIIEINPFMPKANDSSSPTSVLRMLAIVKTRSDKLKWLSVIKSKRLTAGSIAVTNAVVLSSGSLVLAMTPLATSRLSFAFPASTMASAVSINISASLLTWSSSLTLTDNWDGVRMIGCFLAVAVRVLMRSSSSSFLILESSRSANVSPQFSLVPRPKISSMRDSSNEAVFNTGLTRPTSCDPARTTKHPFPSSSSSIR